MHTFLDYCCLNFCIFQKFKDELEDKGERLVAVTVVMPNIK